MKQALQSYTPTVLPTYYDALEHRLGCETQAGNDWFHVLAFNNICVFNHDEHSDIFNQPDTVCYQIANSNSGNDQPIYIPSAAWVGSMGIRYGEGITYVEPPANTTGGPSNLYPNTLTTKVTFAYEGVNNNGLNQGFEYMAIESSKDYINLKYVGTVGVTFYGKSPMLFNAGMLDPSACVVCYYVRSDKPFKLFGRFSADGFLNEYEVIPTLRVNITRIVLAKAYGNVLKLYCIDEDGFDITLTSPSYGPTVIEKAKLNIDFAKGVIFQALLPTTAIPPEPATVTLAFVRGYVADGTAETVALTHEFVQLNIAFDGGNITRVK